MKKFLSLILCFSLLFGVVFAQEGVVADELKVSAEGSATLTWGIDLGSGDLDANKMTHGFYNDTNLKVKIPFFDTRKTYTGGGEKDADVRAELEFKLRPFATTKVDQKGDKEKATVVSGLRSVDGGNVKAKLVFYGAYLQVYDKPFFGSEYALGWEPINVDGGDKYWWFNPEFQGFGGKLGYANKDLMDLDLGLKFGSNGSWHHERKYPSDKKPTENLYALGFDFHMMPVEKYLTLDATVNSTFHSKKDYQSGVNLTASGEKGEDVVTNFGFKIGSEPLDGFKIGLGFDGVTGVKYTTADGKAAWGLGWDLGLTLAYKWVDFGLHAIGRGAEGYSGYDYSQGLTKLVNDGENLALHFGFKSEESGDTNFVEGLAFNVTVNAYDLLGKRYNKDISDAEKKALFKAGEVKDALTTTANDAYKVAYEAWLGTAGVVDSETSQNMYKNTVAGKALWEAKENEDKANKDLPSLPLSRIASIGGTVPVGLNVGLSYKANITDSMWIKPFVKLYGETNHYQNKTGTALDKLYFGVAYEAGLTYSPIEKAEITAKWAHGELNKDTYEGGWGGKYMIKTPANYKNHNGTFTLGVKVKF